MSDALFAGLPRFDAAPKGGAVRSPGSWLQELGSEPAPVAAAPRAQAASVRAEVSSQEAAPAVLDLNRIEASLAALNSKLDKIEREARAQTLQTIKSIASKLFPVLSEQFLAEEISRHLPAMVPASAAVVEIRAEEELAGKLRQLVERIPALAHRCSVTAAPEGQGRVDVSWQSGGLTFNFDALLQASLSHLNSTQTVTKE